MTSITQPGDPLLFSRSFFEIDAGAIGRVGILKTEDGRNKVKEIRPGAAIRGTFDLSSANNLNRTEYSIRLKWAAPMRRMIQNDDI